MKILLIQPPCSHLFYGSGKDAVVQMPLGLPSLSAYLKREGHEAFIIDLNIKMYLDAKEADKGLWHEKNFYLWSWSSDLFFNEILPRLKDIQEKWIDIIIKSSFKIIGFYVSSASQWMALSLARKLKERNNGIAIIFGGPECFKDKAEEFLRTGYVDAVVTSEGEATLLELVNSCEKTGQIKHCPGAFFIENDEIIYGGPRELIKDLDTLPYPDFSDFINDYKALFGDKILLSISWLRGCTHRCAFCYESRFWGPARSRSPENICREFIFQEERYNVKGFYKADSIIAFSEKLLSATCDLLIEKKIDVMWGSQARPDKYMTLELLQKLYKAGCRWLAYGIESGSQSVVDRMNKGFQVKAVENVIINTNRVGIKPSVTIMAGSPGETLIDFMRTVWFILKNRKFIWSIGGSTAAVLPMSDWYLRPEEYGIVIDKDAKDGRYYRFWTTKYFMDNHHVRAIKQTFLENIYHCFFSGKI